MKASRIAGAGIILATIVSLAGCGSNPPPDPVESARPVAATASSAPVETSAAPTVVATAHSSPTPSGPPIVVGSPGSGKKELVLADAFNPGDWTEGSYTPANETTAIKAMAAEVYCNTRQAKELEYRFAQVQGRLTVQVAQDMRSASPDMELEFSLTADGRQVDVKNAEFTGKPELSTDLAGVTVLKIGVKPVPGNSKQCTGSDTTNALITNVVIQQ
jgi:hypothetical protein